MVKKSYLSPEWGMFAQYCRKNAGYCRSFPRRLRRELEIKAYASGISQLTRADLHKGAEMRPHVEIVDMLIAAAQ